MKTKRKKLIIAILIIGAITVASCYIALGSKRDQSPAAYADVVKKGTLVNSDNISGSIQSLNEQSIYSNANYPAKQVLVKEGDVVSEGDVLAVLDVDELEKSIEKLELSIASAEEAISDEKRLNSANAATAASNAKTAEASLQKAQLAYDKAKQEFESGTNAEVDKALYSYELAKSNYENEDSAELIRAKSEIASSEQTLAARKKELEAQTLLFEAGSASKSSLDQAQQAYDAAVLAHESAASSFAKLKESLKATCEQYELDISRMKSSINDAYNQAEMDLKSAKASFEGAQSQVSQAKAKDTGVSQLNKESQDVEIASLKEKLNRAEIVAPISGTVTKVDLKAGQTPSGVVFMIEDMAALQVKTYIKEYDLKNVHKGQKVAIKTDVTGDREYEGEVSYIAPTSRKDVATSNNVEFESKISIKNPDEFLRIGMNARISIILDEKPDALYLPYDCLGENPEGQTVIYAVIDGAVVELPVQTGVESDLFTEVSGEGVAEDLAVLTDPSAAVPGTAVTPIMGY
jgi:multidrug efflux pump subunit AcrA (membrane-fusion protein)